MKKTSPAVVLSFSDRQRFADFFVALMKVHKQKKAKKLQVQQSAREAKPKHIGSRIRESILFIRKILAVIL